MVGTLVAMSGGVDSSVAAALLLEAGHDVVGVTLRLWGGESDSGCCSVSDVDDARRVADTLGIDHHVFNLGAHFDQHVVAPYVTVSNVWLLVIMSGSSSWMTAASGWLGLLSGPRTSLTCFTCLVRLNWPN